MDFIVQGKIVSVDNEDGYLSMSHTWWLSEDQNHVYTTVNRRTIFIHRIIMNLTDPSIQVHHKDDNGLNNCKSNLEVMTKKEHDALLSKKAQINSRSGVVGVHFDKSRNRWRAQIGKKTLGSFSTMDAAIKARQRAVQ